MLLAVDSAYTADEIKRMTKVSELLRHIQLEAAKAKAVEHLVRLASGINIDEADFTSESYRAIEAQRRLCVSIIRLSATPTSTQSRDAANDVRPLPVMQSGKRQSSPYSLADYYESLGGSENNSRSVSACTTISSSANKSAAVNAVPEKQARQSSLSSEIVDNKPEVNSVNENGCEEVKTENTMTRAARRKIEREQRIKKKRRGRGSQRNGSVAAKGRGISSVRGSGCGDVVVDGKPP